MGCQAHHSNIHIVNMESAKFAAEYIPKAAITVFVGFASTKDKVMKPWSVRAREHICAPDKSRHFP